MARLEPFAVVVVIRERTRFSAELISRLLATPHIGYVTEATYASAFQQIVENIAAWLDGKPQRILPRSG